MNFSKTVLWMNIGSIPLLMVLLITSILTLVGREVFSIEFWMFLPRTLVYFFVFSFIGFTVAFTKLESLKKTYLCCLYPNK